jgi:nucleotide-binding universal stress UspA family protein
MAGKLLTDISLSGKWQQATTEIKEQLMSGQEEHAGPRIVAGVDGSFSSLSALRWAIKQAALTGAAVDAVIAWHYPAAAGGYGWAPTGLEGSVDFRDNADKTIADAISGAVAPGTDVPVRARVVEGIPAQVLLDAADGADLLVVGSRGHGGFAEALLGSVSQHCVQHAHCPVVVIRGKEHD